MQKGTNKELDLFKSKLLAHSLLAMAVIVFIVSSLLEESLWWAAFLRATAEAAMVGAIADWFAVTSLFRYPLGIKLPHTAIIPNKKHMIADSLATFISQKFLSEEIITRKFQSMDATRKMAQWIVQDENNSWVATQISAAVAGAMAVIKDEEIQTLVESHLSEEIRSRDFAPFLGKTLLLFTSKNRQREILYLLIEKGSDFLRENKDIVVPRIHDVLPWLFQRFDGTVFQKLVDAVDATLEEVKDDVNHPLHEEFSKYLAKFAYDLQYSNDIKMRERALKEALLMEGGFKEFAGSIWLDIKANLIEFGSRSNQELHEFVQKLLADLGNGILSDEGIEKKIDRWLNGAVVYAVKNYGYEIENLISHTVNGWDSLQVSQEIELQIGKDLQYIRINGTIVGGLVGLVIYSLYYLAKGY